jgi:hypothetical protein
MRESSVLSNAGSSTRKPRQNLDERDHILMVKHCYEQRDNYKEGTKAQFWSGVNAAFQADTGKILAQMSATVGRLVEARRRQIADWENGVIPQKPGGELNDRIDEWMEFLRTEMLRLRGCGRSRLEERLKRPGKRQGDKQLLQKPKWPPNILLARQCILDRSLLLHEKSSSHKHPHHRSNNTHIRNPKVEKWLSYKGSKI